MLRQVQGSDAAGDVHRQGPRVRHAARLHHHRARSHGRPLLLHVQPLPQRGVLGVARFIHSFGGRLIDRDCVVEALSIVHCGELSRVLFLGGFVQIAKHVHQCGGNCLLLEDK